MKEKSAIQRKQPAINPYLMKNWSRPGSLKITVFRKLTGSMRVLPDFIIIGAAKCGTTSLYDYLTQHPSIYSADRKEIYFFDRYYPLGINWYKGFFRLKIFKNFKKINGSFLTGEATPTYIHHPLAAERISKSIPKAKLIVLLRNPVDRAFSSYNMQKKHGIESLTFQEAIKAEESRLAGEYEKMISNPNYYSYYTQWYAYLTRGIYVDQLKVWMKFFPKNQFLIIKSEDFFENEDNIYHQVLTFLNLPYKKIKFEKQNVGKYEQMDKKIRKELLEFFKPHNERLYQFLGKDFGWNTMENID